VLHALEVLEAVKMATQNSENNVQPILN